MAAVVAERSTLGDNAAAASALRDTQLAFDGVAASYHQSNADNELLCAMRERTRAALERFVAPGSRLLDLGCGPGSDVVYFAKNGFHVTGIDSSPAMVGEADGMLRAAGLEQQASVEQLDIESLAGSDAALRPFDAAYSSFGPLNCVENLSEAARAIAQCVRDGGVLVASVIGRICPWELALYAGRWDLGRVRIRFSRSRVPVPLQGRTVWTRYYTPAEFARAFECAGFATISWRALGLCTPPPYLAELARRHPRAIAVLQRVEDRMGGWPGLRACGDHFLIVMRRTMHG